MRNSGAGINADFTLFCKSRAISLRVLSGGELRDVMQYSRQEVTILEPLVGDASENLARAPIAAGLPTSRNHDTLLRCSLRGHYYLRPQ